MWWSSTSLTGKVQERRRLKWVTETTLLSSLSYKMRQRNRIVTLGQSSSGSKSQDRIERGGHCRNVKQCQGNNAGKEGREGGEQESKREGMWKGTVVKHRLWPVHWEHRFYAGEEQVLSSRHVPPLDGPAPTSSKALSLNHLFLLLYCPEMYFIFNLYHNQLPADMW